MAETTNVQVALRVRPLTSKEVYTNANECVSLVPSAPNQVCIGADRSFTFDHVFGSEANQEDVFTTLTPLLDRFIEGRNAAVLAYGQTGSGKTYTMGTGLEEGLDLTNAGLVYRAITYLFDHVRSWPSQTHTASISVSFLELYNEELVDLLNPATRHMKKRNGVGGVLSIREDGKGGVVWDGVQEEAAETPEDVMTFLKKGSLCRTTGSTDMNAVSSRSHAIFSIILKQEIDESGHGATDNDPFRRETRSTSAASSAANSRPSSSQGGRMTKKLLSKLNFVDLAGSERLKRTNAVGDRAKEGISINTGLLALGNVISALGDDTKRFKSGHIPYRDSKLTRLLQDCLGGNSQTLMMACVSPADSNFMETLNTLKYANRARNIKNKVTINQDFGAMEINQLRAEVRRLRQDLANARLGTADLFLAEGGAMTSASTNAAPGSMTPRSLMSMHAASGTENAIAKRLKSENAVLLNEVNKLNLMVSQKESRIQTLAASIVVLETEKDTLTASAAADPTFLTNPEHSDLIKSYKSNIMQLTLALDDAKDRLAASTLQQAQSFNAATASPRFATSSSASSKLPFSLSMPDLFGNDHNSHKRNRSPSRPGTTAMRQREISGGNAVLYGKEGKQINETLARAKEELRAEMLLLDEKRRQIARSSTLPQLHDDQDNQSSSSSVSELDDDDNDPENVGQVDAGDAGEDVKMEEDGNGGSNADEATMAQEAARTTTLLSEATEELEHIQSQIESRQGMIAALEQSQQSVQAMLENHKYEHDLMMQRHDEKIAQLVYKLSETEKVRELLATKESKKSATAQDIQSKREADEKIRALKLELQTKRREADDTRARYGPKIEAQEAMIKKYKVELDRARGDRAKMMKKIREKETAVREITLQKENQSLRLRRTQQQTEALKKEMEKRDRSHKLAMKRTQQDFQSKIKSMLKKATSPARPKNSAVAVTYPNNSRATSSSGISPMKLFGRRTRNSAQHEDEDDFVPDERGSGGSGGSAVDTMTRKKNLLEENIKICVEAKHVSTSLEEIVMKRDTLVEEKVALLSDRDQILKTDTLSSSEQEARLQILSDRMETVEAEIRWFNGRLKSLQSETSSRDMSDWSASYSEAVDLLYGLHRSERKAMMTHLLEEVLGLRAKEASNNLMKSEMEMEMSNLRRTLRVIQNTAVVTQVQTETKAYGFRREVSKRLHTILKKTEETLANSKTEFWTVHQVRNLLKEMTAMSYGMEQLSQQATPADFGSPRGKQGKPLFDLEQLDDDADEHAMVTREGSPKPKAGSSGAGGRRQRQDSIANEYEQLALEIDKLENLEADLNKLLPHTTVSASSLASAHHATKPVASSSSALMAVDEDPFQMSSSSSSAIPPRLSSGGLFDRHRTISGSSGTHIPHPLGSSSGSLLTSLGGHDVFERLASTHTQASQAKAIQRLGSIESGLTGMATGTATQDGAEDASHHVSNSQQPPPLPSSSHHLYVPSSQISGRHPTSFE